MLAPPQRVAARVAAGVAAGVAPGIAAGIAAALTDALAGGCHGRGCGRRGLRLGCFQLEPECLPRDDRLDRRCDRAAAITIGPREGEPPALSALLEGTEKVRMPRDLTHVSHFDPRVTLVHVEPMLDPMLSIDHRIDIR